MKPVLGRNLGTLLGGKVTPPSPESSVAPAPSPTGPGVQSLLRGQAPQEVPQAAPPVNKPAIPVWYYFAADLLLVAMAILFACRHPEAVTWKQRFFYASLVALGGCLAMAGVWLGRSKD